MNKIKTLLLILACLAIFGCGSHATANMDPQSCVEDVKNRVHSTVYNYDTFIFSADNLDGQAYSTDYPPTIVVKNNITGKVTLYVAVPDTNDPTKTNPELDKK